MVLATKYELGDGVPKSLAEAANWYRKAAEQGHSEAQFFLGFAYDFGAGLPVDKALAAKWYRRAAEQGDSAAAFALGNSYESGEGISQDYTEAVKWYRYAAEKGDPAAQLALGRMFAAGKGVSKDVDKAIEWFDKATTDLASAYAVARIFEEGIDVPLDEVRAFELYFRCAESGSMYAQFQLATLYFEGKGTDQDYNEAAKWFQRAADQGNNDALLRLATMYDEGKGVPKDPGQAAIIRKQVNTTRVEGTYKLGVMLDTGDVFPKNDAAAVIQFCRAANQGHTLAQGRLGEMCAAGEGTSRNLVEAYKWLTLALANAPDDDTRGRWSSLLSSITNEMTEKQISDASKLAQELTPDLD